MTGIIKMEFHWKRPTTVPFPKVWRRFEAKSPNGETQKFIIQDLTPDRHEEAWEFFRGTFCVEEPVYKALKMTEDADIMPYIKEIFIKTMQQNLSVITIPDEPADKPQMAGLLILAAESRNDELVTLLPGPKAEKFERLMGALKKDINVFDKLDTDVFLEDYGMAVVHELRGRNIAQNMTMTIEDIAREFGIGGKIIIISNLNMLPSYKRENIVIFREIIYNDFRDEDGNIIVPVTEFKYIAYCGRKILL